MKKFSHQIFCVSLAEIWPKGKCVSIVTDCTNANVLVYFPSVMQNIYIEHKRYQLDTIKFQAIVTY